MLLEGTEKLVCDTCHQVLKGVKNGHLSGVS